MSAGKNCESWGKFLYSTLSLDQGIKVYMISEDVEEIDLNLDKSCVISFHCILLAQFHNNWQQIAWFLCCTLR